MFSMVEYLNMSFFCKFTTEFASKKVWKSVNIWWSYGQEFGVVFFDSQCAYKMNATPVLLAIFHENVG